MKITEIERVIHIDTYDAGRFYCIAMHLSLDCDNNYITISSDVLSKAERKYLSSIINFKVKEIDSICIYLKVNK